MTVILYLLGGSLVLGAAALAIFLWSLRDGQYDDMEGAANRILFDDDDGPLRKPEVPTGEHGGGKPIRLASTP
jgi:cbb3-type cytochrome oxidase maturation protein